MASLVELPRSTKRPDLVNVSLGRAGRLALSHTWLAVTVRSHVQIPKLESKPAILFLPPHAGPQLLRSLQAPFRSCA